MAYTTTTKWLLRKLTGGSLVSDVDAGFDALAEDLDPLLTPYDAGALASRPVSTPGSPGKAGRTYRATDTDELFLDTGTAWAKVPQGAVDLAALGLSDPVTARRGKSIIATEEFRTNTSYITMITPDTVTVTLPTDGIMFIAASLSMKESVQNSARAAIFLGANQLKGFVPGSAAPAALETGFLGAGLNSYVYMATGANGLVAGYLNETDGSSTNPAYTGDVPTGQAICSASTTIHNFDPTDPSVDTVMASGICPVFAAAGTYAVSLQFKVTSGTVTVKDRKLWVWTQGF